MMMCYVFHLGLISAMMIMSQCNGSEPDLSSAGKKVHTLTLELLKTKQSTADYFQKNPEKYYDLLCDGDDARSRYLFGIEANTTTAPVENDIIFRPISPRSKVGWAFSVLVTVGKPPQTQPLMLDTGSSLTWFQCNPDCVRCHPVHQFGTDYPIYDRAKSHTGTSVQCGTADCVTSYTSCGDSDHGPSCIFEIGYQDGTYAKGKLIYEMIVLGGREIMYPTGCSLDTSDEDTYYTGIFGLGRGRLSLAERIIQNYVDLNVFSYCLAPDQSTALIFGNDYASMLSSSAHVSTLNYDIPYTKMISNPYNPPLYYVDMVGISIGSGDIIKGTEESVFRISGAKGGIIMDTGSTMTFLIPEAYNAVINAFKEMASGLPGWVPSTPLVGNLTCYDLSYYMYPDPHPIQFKSLFFHFRSAPSTGDDKKRRRNQDEEIFKLELGFDNVMTWISGQPRNIYCLALRESKRGVSIIGMINQRHIRIVHDIMNERIGFDKNGCFI